MANITVDGKQITVKDGITIIEALDQVNTDVPRYCYHPGLSIAGNCRICQVEVEKMPRTVIACNTRVAEGMVIHTQSAKAKESQQVVLEFLLANHPLDCPVCDQAGECKLQDYYMDYGLYDAKFNDTKVKKTKKATSIGPTIMLDQERCILCSRCVRFGDEITKTHDFGIFNRGDHAQLDIYPGKQLDNKYSGNVADICPVGALTDKDFRFKMRVWYLGSQDSVCTGCSTGCNTIINYEKSRPYHLKDARVMRLKPRENQDVNKWWMCDEGRYSYKSIDENRIKQIKTPGFTSSVETNGLQDAIWNQTLDTLAPVLKGASATKWALLVSPQGTNEDLHAAKKVFKDTLKWTNIAFKAPGQDGYEDNFLIKKDKNPNTSGTKAIFQVPDSDEAMKSIVEKAKKGELEGLVIFYHNLGKIFGEDTLKTIRQKVKTLIFIGTNNNSTSAAADYVLPAASYAEKDGTFTNFAGRAQRIRKAFEPIGHARSSWWILAELNSRLGQKTAYANVEAVFNELAKDNSVFKDLTYKTIGKSGALLGAAK